MEFTLKNQDATSAILSVNIQEADYSALVEKQLKNFRQKANIPLCQGHGQVAVLPHPAGLRCDHAHPMPVNHFLSQLRTIRLIGKQNIGMDIHFPNFG
jgi:hypothetical protein